ncbi:hypothetical protein [Actinomadura alba]|uniref:Uncharacterized protein n=1 Tax=Actinomadura alba TaxID=406431 RepID=A0ABR7LYT2_9ACTN|nr:hypothetical protein [Actinomadura alba]MBC6469916.1 hypothetical protein [Actinomadura alba]
MYDFEEATPAFLDAWSATEPAWRRLADGLAADAERRGDDANAGDVAVVEADRAFHGAAQAVEACLQPLRRAYYLKVDAVCARCRHRKV